MVARNPNLARLKAGYLFPEIGRRRREFAALHPEDPARPETRIISLGVGNTTEPLLPHIRAGLEEGARRLGQAATYTGYADEGLPELRQRIACVFYGRAAGGPPGPEEIFISDGAKCDIGRLQLLFGAGAKVAVQDPSYPVYVDGSVLANVASRHGHGSSACADDSAAASSRPSTNEVSPGGGYAGVTYLPCTAENGYFPDLSRLPDGSVFYFCSPNNPTGYVMNRAQLEALVAFARAHACIILFDAAYAEFIRDESLPKTIYAVEGAETCAIEINSFSKPAGFTGVRLGWTIVPVGLTYEDGSSVNKAWDRVMATIFNGASNIAQAGGLAALTEQGKKEIRALTDYYLQNARLIKKTLEAKGIHTIGGQNSPYIWAQFPGQTSWDVFDKVLETCHIVTTPGSGFGPAGESFVRFSAFGHHEDVKEACARLEAATL